MSYNKDPIDTAISSIFGTISNLVWITALVYGGAFYMFYTNQLSELPDTGVFGSIARGLLWLGALTILITQVRKELQSTREHEIKMLELKSKQ